MHTDRAGAVEEDVVVHYTKGDRYGSTKLISTFHVPNYSHD